MALDNFFRFLSDFKSVAAILGKAVLPAPFLGYIFNIGPPWPDKRVVPALITLAGVFVQICLFQFSTSLPERRLKGQFRLFIILFIVFFTTYLVLDNYFVYDVPITHSRDVQGFKVRPEIQKILGPDYTIDKALAGEEWDAFAIWEVWTVKSMRLFLLLSWILSFAALVGSIAIFVLLQQRVNPRR